MMDAWYLHHGVVSSAFPFAFPFALPLLALVGIWSVGIKGYALWHAARNEQTAWFVVLLIVNLLGIPELIYLVWFRADKATTRKVAPAPVPAPSTQHDSSEEK